MSSKDTALNQPALVGVSNEKQKVETSGYRKIQRTIAIVSCIMAVLVLVFSIQNFIRFRAEKEYRNEVSILKSKVNEIKIKVKSCIDPGEKTVAENIQEIESLPQSSSFKDELKRLNDHPKYKTVQVKETTASLGIDLLMEDLDSLKNDGAGLRSFMKDQQGVDDKFLALKERKDCTYETLLEVCAELERENSEQKSRVNKMAATSQMEQTVKKIQKAMEFRGKSIKFYQWGLMADMDSKLAMQTCNSFMEEATQYISTAKSSRGVLDQYTGKAKKATNEARVQEEMVRENLQSAQKHYVESINWMEKYKKMMGMISEK
ncbi:MAG: hypothetical protein N2484_11700 [Clostridia bacterium]|nr:hypothetical protein [Clostridia bacterium]